MSQPNIDATTTAVLQDRVQEASGQTEDDDDYSFSPEQVEAIKRIFRHFDTDGSDTIDRKELRKLCAFLG